MSDLSELAQRIERKIVDPFSPAQSDIYRDQLLNEMARGIAALLRTHPTPGSPQ